MAAHLNSIETKTISIGFFIAGLAIAVTTVSYALNMTFDYQWLVWAITAVFAIVAILILEWPRAFQHLDKIPSGKLRNYLLLSIPLAFILSSQVCGLGVRACNFICHLTNLSLIGLAAVTSIRLHRNKPVVSLLISMIVISFIPHCVCHAPINILWHRTLSGFAPTCEMVPMAAVLFSVTALRGRRPHASTVLSVAMLGIILFITVGSSFFGFPWKGCVDYPIG
jgi:hypothetical protein